MVVVYAAGVIDRCCLAQGRRLRVPAWARNGLRTASQSRYYAYAKLSFRDRSLCGLGLCEAPTGVGLGVVADQLRGSFRLSIAHIAKAFYARHMSTIDLAGATRS